MTAIIADDEHLARALLRQLLESEELEVLAEAESGAQALEYCVQLQPDLLFCDIRMPDLDGLETAAALTQLDRAPLLIFVSGYSEHAAEAYELAAFDYVVKPINKNRLRLSLERSRKRLLEGLSNPNFQPLKRIPIRTDYALRLLKVEEVLAATSKQKRVFIHTASEEFKTNYTLTQLEQMLPVDAFLRIHASAIVRVDEVEEINFLGNHTYDVRLSSGFIAPVGRAQYPELQRRLGL